MFKCFISLETKLNLRDKKEFHRLLFDVLLITTGRGSSRPQQVWNMDGWMDILKKEINLEYVGFRVTLTQYITCSNLENNIGDGY